MSPLLQTVLALATVGVIVAVLGYPLATWLHRVFTDERHWRVERAIYRIVGVDPNTEQRWSVYAISVVAFGVVSVVALWLLILVQGWLPWSFGRSQTWHGALNTAISFTTNTNWQSYAGEAGAGHTVQMLGLTVQNFVSAATGLAVAIALVRGLARAGADRVGNFWVDLTRGSVRVLLPIATVAALLLILGGVIQNLNAPSVVQTLTGGPQTIPGGPVASQEAIKMLGTNGGGFFNANSAHPFENPNAWTNLLEIVLVLLIPFALTRTYGLMVGDRRQGRLVAAVMAVLFAGAALLTTWSETAASTLATGSMEGKEERFGIAWSALFGTATTATSTGAVNSMHESYSPLGGGMLMLNMMLGEVSPGGVGTGLYGMLVLAIITVFIAGLMVGRTPELLGKTVGRKEITYAALASIIMPTLVLTGTAISLLLPSARAAMLADGPHGLSEMLYAFSSAGNNNGSAFAGLSADQPWLNLSLGAVMFLARFGIIVLTLALAGALASQLRRPVTAGTMPTHTPIFGVLLVGIVLLLAGLTFFPSLALGPLAEALS
ncbi:potassium translocating ATPase, subunit A [Phycicoccus elongatus Lp2]|jgi:K+-transporting ATPase ATPase A chain|uniref:Potassium-transporting ATPase potassium-binding subunit n=1 Tax=Phycicoccus elongatus Lp2 TaxID=1193181 RepID=N0DY71_9MICO|nr:potassium-transporting ATPase subunit KdpA [Phycicoccus elongatus]CCH69253.1 potassium translocating ATPase, subunit A [Phycicoccus elongatus Lp2]